MEQVAPFSVHVTSDNDVAWLALRGELDMSVVDRLKEPIATFEGSDVASIVLDLRDLTFVDSSGLHAILGARRRSEANGHQLRVVGASPTVRRVFEITGTGFVIDDSEAVGALDGVSDGQRSVLARDASGGDHDA